MMTLDEVIIGIKEQIGLGDPILIDALHYLKEYKNKQNVETMMFALHNTNKTVCDDCWLSREMAGEGFKQIYKKYIEEENPPLTWDELKTMEGKSVWYEHEFWKGWIILGKVEQGVNCEMIPDREERWYIVKDGSAKAYRKERK